VLCEIQKKTRTKPNNKKKSAFSSNHLEMTHWSLPLGKTAAARAARNLSQRRERSRPVPPRSAAGSPPARGAGVSGPDSPQTPHSLLPHSTVLAALPTAWKFQAPRDTFGLGRGSWHQNIRCHGTYFSHGQRL